MGWGLPTSVELGSETYAIETDYRDILEIIKVLSDPDTAETERIYVSMALFYDDFAAMPESDWPQAVDEMMRFIAVGEEDDGHPAPQLIDWEQDETMIAADINKAAGCEVRALPYLHWWTFVAYFGAIGEGQLSTVVAIRDKLRRGKKLEKWEREYYQKNKARIQLRPKYTAEELAEQTRLKELLGE